MHDELLELVKEAHEHQHEHELEDEEEEHEHHHHHHDHDEEHEHHHDHDEESHEHHHDHGPDCTCGCHDHDHEGHEHHHHHHHHHHGDADETFQSWGKESPKPFTKTEIETILTALDSGEYGQVLRAKGIVPDGQGGWLEFDFVPGEREIRESRADYTGRLCVIGSELKEGALAELFGL